MAAILEKCPHCGNEVLFMGDNCPSCQGDRNLDSHVIHAQQKQVEAAKQHREIEDRPVSNTAGRLLLGGAIISFATLMGAFLSPKVALSSLIGCIAGLGIVAKFLFGGADALDKARWKRYWHGDLLGYWISYTVLFITIPISGNADLLLIYILASVIAAVAGLANVLRSDSRDKRTIVSQLSRCEQDEP